MAELSKYFKSSQELTDYLNGENIPSNILGVVVEDETVKEIAFGTNDIEGEYKTYRITDEYPTPTGTINITANGENIDVKQYATANVAVPQPSGKITITQNGTDINVNDYATADVNVPNGPSVNCISTYGPYTNVFSSEYTYSSSSTELKLYICGTNLTEEYIDNNLEVTHVVTIGDATFSGPTKTTYNPFTNTKVGDGELCYVYSYIQTGIAEVTWTIRFGEFTKTIAVNYSK